MREKAGWDKKFIPALYPGNNSALLFQNQWIRSACLSRKSSIDRKTTRNNAIHKRLSICPKITETTKISPSSKIRYSSSIISSRIICPKNFGANRLITTFQNFCSRWVFARLPSAVSGICFVSCVVKSFRPVILYEILCPFFTKEIETGSWMDIYNGRQHQQPVHLNSYI